MTDIDKLQKSIDKLDAVTSSTIGKNCGDNDHFCKGAMLVFELNETIQRMQECIDAQQKQLDLLSSAECRDHEQIERCKKLMEASVEKF